MASDIFNPYAALRQLVGCNEAYFGAVAKSLQSKEYVEGFAFDGFSGVVIDSPSLAAMSDPAITMDGAIYVGENSRMRKAADFAGPRIRGRALCGHPGGNIAYLIAPNTIE